MVQDANTKNHKKIAKKEKYKKETFKSYLKTE